jgi:hypothetical protein
MISVKRNGLIVICRNKYIRSKEEFIDGSKRRKYVLCKGDPMAWAGDEGPDSPLFQ